MYMRVCWNWQTGTFEGRVRERMGSSPICRTKKDRNSGLFLLSWDTLMPLLIPIRVSSASRLSVCKESRIRFPYHNCCGDTSARFLPPRIRNRKNRSRHPAWLSHKRMNSFVHSSLFSFSKLKTLFIYQGQKHTDICTKLYKPIEKCKRVSEAGPFKR